MGGEYLMAHDAASANTMMSAMGMISGKGSSVILLLIAAFVAWRFALVWINEGFNVKWFATVTLALIAFNFVVGLPFGMSGSALRPVSNVITTNAGGERSKPVTVQGGTIGSKFETLAAQFGAGGDDVLANGVGDNLAGVSFKTDDVTVYATPTEKITGGTAADAPQYSSFLSMLTNMFNSASTWAAHYSEQQVVKNELEDAGMLEEAESSGPSAYVSELFASDGGGGGSVGQKIIAALPTSYPGGPQQYFKYVGSRIFDSSLVHSGATTNVKDIAASISEGRNPAAVGSQTGADSFAGFAAAAGFDAQAAGVKPEYFLRTHTEMFKKQCMQNIDGLRAEAPKPASAPGAPVPAPTPQPAPQPTSGIAALASLDPCGVGVDSPMVSALASAVGAKDPLSQLNSSLQQTASQLFGQLAGMAGSTDLKQIVDLRVPFTSRGSCQRSGSVNGMIQQYQQRLSSGADSDNANSQCLKMGLQLAQVSKAMIQNADQNQAAYDEALSSSSSYAIEADSVLAIASHTTDTGDVLAANDPWKSDLGGSALARQMGKLAVTTANVNLGEIGNDGLKMAVDAAPPGAYKNTGAMKEMQKGLDENAARHAAHEKARDKMDWKARIGDHLLEAGENILAQLKAWAELLFKIVAVIFAIPIMMAVMAAFVMMKYVVAAATGISVGLLPLWATLALNRVFHGNSDDGSQEGGIAVFPFLTLMGAPVVNGMLNTMISVSQGAVTDFIRNSATYIPEMMYSGVQSAMQGLLGVGGNPIATMEAAMVPLGVMAAAAVPVFMASKLLAGQIFAHMAVASAAGGVAGSGQNAGGQLMSKAGSLATSVATKGAVGGKGGSGSGSKSLTKSPDGGDKK